jgi:predicted esterase
MAGMKHPPTMLRLPVLAALLIVCPGCPVLQSQDTPVSELERVEPSSGSHYFLYVPSNYDPARAWPLVVTLHGTHGFDDFHQQVREWKALAEANGFLVLSPQLSSPQGILPVARPVRQMNLEQDDQRILLALAEVKKNYHVNENAVMISGFSAGGYAMYFTGLRHPELFQTMVGRGTNWDYESVRAIPLTEQTKKIHVFIFFGETSITPFASQMSPLIKDCWAAFRYLRQHGFKSCQIQAIKGGHERRPDLAWNYWKNILSRQGALLK